MSMNQNIIKKLKLAPYVHSHPETDSVVHPSPPLAEVHFQYQQEK